MVDAKCICCACLRNRIRKKELKYFGPVSLALLLQMGLDLLRDKAAMLSEYFSVVITPEGTLSHLPLVLENYEPDAQWISHFLLSLVSKVSGEREKEASR